MASPKELDALRKEIIDKARKPAEGKGKRGEKKESPELKIRSTESRTSVSIKETTQEEIRAALKGLRAGERPSAEITKQAAQVAAEKLAVSAMRGEISVEDAMVLISHIGAEVSESPTEAKTYGRLIQVLMQSSHDSQMDEAVSLAARQFQESATNGVIGKTQAHLVVEAIISEGADLPHEGLLFAGEFAKTAPPLSTGKTEQTKDDRQTALDREIYDLLLQVQTVEIPDEQRREFEQVLLDLRRAVSTSEPNPETIRQVAQSLRRQIDSLPPVHTESGDRTRVEKRAAEKVAQAGAARAYPEDLGAAQKLYQEDLKPLRVELSGGSGLPAPEPVTTELFTPTELGSWGDEGRKLAEQVMRKLRMDPGKLGSAQELGKLRDDLTKEAARRAEKLPGPDEARVLETDASKIVERLRKLEKDAIQRSSSSADKIRAQMQVLEGSLTSGGYALAEIRKRYEADRGRPIPGELATLISDLEDDRMGVRYVDTGAEDDRWQPVRLKPEDIKLEDLQRRINQAYAANQILSTERDRMLEMAQDLRQKAVLGEAYQKSDYDYSGRLRELGVTTERQLETYKTATTPEYFLQKLRECRTPKDKKEFIEDFVKDASKLSKTMLSIIDTDHKQFSDQLFSQLIHEPMYNAFTAGLSRISNQLAAQEIGNEPDQGVKDLTFEAKKYNHATRKYEVDSTHPMKGSEYMNELVTWVQEMKFWKSYTHNVYVLMSTHNFESFAKYANQVSATSISMLLEDMIGGNGDVLESAIALYQAYVHDLHGLNYWKAVGGKEEVFLQNPDNPRSLSNAAQYAKDRLLDQFDIKPEEADWYVGIAQGYNLGVGMKSINTILTSGPVAGSGGGDAAVAEQFGPIHLNPSITCRRFMQELGFPDYRFLYTRAGGRKSQWRTWSPRFVINEVHEAERLMEERKLRDRDRIYTDYEFEEQGLAIIDWHDFVMQSGSFDTRGWRWRGRTGLDHFVIPNGKGGIDYEKSIKGLAEVNPSYANSLIQMAWGKGDIDRKQRDELRMVVFDRLRQIAPQFAIAFDRDTLWHSNLDEFRAELAGSSDKTKQLGDEFNAKLRAVVLDAEAISRYLLSGEGDHPRTVEELGTDFAKWKNALFPVKSRDHGADADMRVRRAMKLMRTLHNEVVGQVIDKGVTVVVQDSPKKTRTKKIEPWKRAAFIRGNVPTHYSTERDVVWENMGKRVVGRLVGDNDRTAEGFNKFYEEFRQAIFNIQTDPQKAKDAGYLEPIMALRALSNVIEGVHGPENQEEAQAQVAMAGYMFTGKLADWFGKGTVQRYVPGLSSISPYSSWVHLKTGSTKAEIEAQEARKIADTAVDQRLMVKADGALETGKWVNDELNERFNTKIFSSKLVPKIRRPGYEWKDLRIYFLGKEFRTNIKYPALKYSPWNAGRWRLEHGAAFYHIALDVAETLIPAIIALIIISALEHSSEDEKKR